LQEKDRIANPRVLSGVKLFAGIRETDIATLCAAVGVSERRYPRGAALVHQGESVRRAGILIEGMLRDEKYHMDGGMQITRTYSRGATINLEALTSTLRTSPTVVIASTPARVIWMRFDALLHCEAASPTVRKALTANVMRILADESIKLMYRSDILSKRTVRERVLTYLSILRERRDSESVDIGMTQKEFANFLCVDRSSLSEELNRLRREGRISFRGTKYRVR
jgi:CRP-like cAMP-binding protein